MSLDTNLQNLATRVATEFKGHRNLISGGASNLSGLQTVAKGNLVAAINELVGAIGGAGAAIDDETVSALTVWSSAKTDAEIDAAVNALVSAAPGALDTLNELAQALGDNPNFATDMATLIGTKADSNNPVFTGTVTMPDGSLAIADTAGLQAALDAKITAPADPNADRILFWDDSATAFVFLALSGLTISGTTMSVNAASETATGVVERATLAEVTTGTDATRYVTPQGVRQEILTRAAATHSHAAADITDLATAVPAAVPAASETVQGKVELATVAEATTGADTTRAVTPAGLKAVADTKAGTTHSHTSSDITNFSTAAAAAVPAASETVAGKVELATTAETTTGTDTARAVTPAGLKAVADTKAATGHGHALTDANITGVLPIAQIPVGTAAGTVAAGNHGHTAANISDFNTSVDARVNSLVPTATVTAAGKVELATDAEVLAGTDTARAVTPAGLRSVTGNTETDLVAVFEAALV